VLCLKELLLCSCFLFSFMFMSYDLKVLIVELGRTEICEILASSTFIVTLESLRGLIA
jgi:hypothetical protein